MFGAVIGDLIGSLYLKRDQENEDFEEIKETEAEENKSESKSLIRDSRYSEISVMTLAVAAALMNSMPVCPAEGGKICNGGLFQSSLIGSMKKFGRKFSKLRYGRKFNTWLHSKKSFPYETLSNGAALRISPVAWAFDNIFDVERFAELTARVTTNTAETVKFSRTLAGMIFLARMKKDKDEIKNYFEKRAEINFSTEIEKIRPDFIFTTKCRETIPAAFAAFYESGNFDETIEKSISLGGETTATASMAGALTQAYSGVSILTEVETYERLHSKLKFIVEKFEQWKK